MTYIFKMILKQKKLKEKLFKKNIIHFLRGKPLAKHLALFGIKI